MSDNGQKLKPGDKINIGGGYDMEPAWLKGNEKGYEATVLKFIDYRVTGRQKDGTLAAVIEFNKTLHFKWLKGKYGFMLTRYEG
ncbi:MAG TPA: hypothetical protein VEB42_00450, partial [Chitinophagaceae bacterium]|nr:hypothetical protein [Chitinophagaceae bacterium]